MVEERIDCLTADGTKKNVTIPRWKYDLVRAALLEVIPDEPKGIEFSALSDAVAQVLSKEDRVRLGSITWHVVVVKLDLEGRKLIERIPGVGRQRVRRTG